VERKPRALIDLHLHSSVSDGLYSPRELVRRAWNAGIRVMAVTDHDTMSGLGASSEAASMLGMKFITGVEVTAVHGGSDVHVLGYGLPADAPALNLMIAQQRHKRALRAREIAARLARLGAPIDVEALVASGGEGRGKAIARPQIAAQLVAAGHVSSIAEAFERFLGEQCPAYVPHQGASPAEVVSAIVASGGVASLAHPGKWNRDDLIPGLIGAGMSCLEVFCGWHDSLATEHYRTLARRYGLLATGGSDYHGPGTRHAELFGTISLPEPDFRRLETLLASRISCRRAAVGGAPECPYNGSPRRKDR